MEDIENTEEKLIDNIDKILNGTPAQKRRLHTKFFFMAVTPDLLKENGLAGDFFQISYNRITHHRGKDKDHNLSAQDWKDLCVEITRPFGVTEYGPKQGKKKRKSFRMFTRQKINGKYGAVGVEVRSLRDGAVKVNAVITAFGFNGNTEGNTEKHTLIYVSSEITGEQKALLDGLNSLSLRSAHPSGAILPHF
jgi:hypothetical protein